jgi:hypothetical protein
MVNDKPRLKINPKTGLPHHVWKTSSGYRFEIQVDNTRYRTITYKNPYVAAWKGHTSDWYLTGRSER